MKKQFSIALLLGSMFSFSQIGLGTSSPEASAQLDVSSTTKGFLIPRMTNLEKTAIQFPVAGLQVWCTDCGFNKGQLQFFNGTAWIAYPIVVGSTNIRLAPRNVVAIPGNGQASVSFAAPSGSFVYTNYTVTSSPGTTPINGPSSPITVPGLINGTSYTFTVVATSAAGNSPASAASSAVTPFTVPGPPTSVVATPSYAQASVSFIVPGFNGGSDVTGYTVTSSPGEFTATGNSSPITVSGLTNETAYTFRVVATNAAGNSAFSASSTAVTPNCGAYVSAVDFKLFKCHNLGVDTSRDPFSYQGGAINGDLYQWGRKADGHQIRNSSTIATQATTILAMNPSTNTVVARYITSFDNWLTLTNNILWGNGDPLNVNPGKGANDPCPLGFEVPSQSQWTEIINNNSWSWTGNGILFGEFLYLPAGGGRSDTDGGVGQVGITGFYWNSLGENGITAGYLRINSSGPGSTMVSNYRANGYSVRCVSE